MRRSVDKLRSAFFSPLLSSFPELSVISLHFFHLVLIKLSLLNVPCYQRHWVLSKGGIRRQYNRERSFNFSRRKFAFRDFNWIVILHLPHIPVSLPIKVYIAHIVSIQLTHNLAVFEYLPLEVVLSQFLAASSDLIKGLDTIIFIDEFTLACYQVIQGSEESILELVLMRCIRDLRAISKHHRLGADHTKVDRVDVCLGWKWRVPVPAIKLVRADLQEIRYRWMVHHLLEKHLSPILQPGLVSLPEDRVKGLVEKMRRVNVA